MTKDNIHFLENTIESLKERHQKLEYALEKVLVVNTLKTARIVAREALKECK